MSFIKKNIIRIIKIMLKKDVFYIFVPCNLLVFTMPLLICSLATLKNFLIFLKTSVFAFNIICRASNSDVISPRHCHHVSHLCTHLQLLLSKREIQVRIVVLCSPSGHKASKKFLDPIPHETAAVNQKGDILESAYSELGYSKILFILKQGEHLTSAHCSVRYKLRLCALACEDDSPS